MTRAETNNEVRRVVPHDVTWTLIVHWYPHVADEGATPYASLPDSLRGVPGAYTPHEFVFVRPPSIADFEQMCESLPWAGAAFEALLELVRVSQQWPVIHPGKKADQTVLYRDGGVEVGRLEIRRTTLWRNH